MAVLIVIVVVERHAVGDGLQGAGLRGGGKVEVQVGEGPGVVGDARHFFELFEGKVSCSVVVSRQKCPSLARGALCRSWADAGSAQRNNGRIGVADRVSCVVRRVVLFELLLRSRKFESFVVVVVNRKWKSSFVL